jgi:hypothetical protein
MHTWLAVALRKSRLEGVLMSLLHYDVINLISEPSNSTYSTGDTEAGGPR